MYKTIIFDLDDTLINNCENKKGAFKKVLEYRKEDYSQEKFDVFNKIDKEFWNNRTKKAVTDPYKFKNKDERTEWIRAQRMLEYFKDETYDNAVKLNNIYIEGLKSCVLEINGAEEIVKYLYNKKYKLVVATNGPSISLNAKLEGIKIDKYIDLAVSADQIGHMKPHDEFYIGLFEKLGRVKKEEILFIGDEIDVDIKGGIKYNIDTCLCNYKNEKTIRDFKPKYEIHNLLELKNIL